MATQARQTLSVDSDQRIFRVTEPREYRKAGPTDLVRLQPVPGSHPLFVEKWRLEVIVYGIARHEFIHLSGPTGSAKSSLIEALSMVPENFRALCTALGLPDQPLKVYPIEMALFETPGELYQRRALKEGTTYDEPSVLLQALTDAVQVKPQAYPLIWLREMGRVQASSVQGGLLDLMTRGDILLPDGRRLDGRGIAWIADSNYQADTDATHTLVTLDDALKRRFSLNLTLDYLSASQEVQILRYLTRVEPHARPGDAALCEQVVKLGHVIRQRRAQGTLLSLTPPTIYGYLALLRLASALPHLSLQQAAMSTMLGNASAEDHKLIPGVFTEVFGLQSADEAAVAPGNLF
jgi:MoxR-like ATPase